MQESLPQQLLMLLVADGALKDARIELDEERALRTGVFIGIGLDFNSTQFFLSLADSEQGQSMGEDSGVEFE